MKLWLQKNNIKVYSNYINKQKFKIQAMNNVFHYNCSLLWKKTITLYSISCWIALNNPYPHNKFIQTEVLKNKQIKKNTTIILLLLHKCIFSSLIIILHIQFNKYFKNFFNQHIQTVFKALTLSVKTAMLLE